MRCDCSLGREECNCCGQPTYRLPSNFAPTEPIIPTQLDDLEEERGRVSGLVVALLWAFFIVFVAFMIVSAQGPK